KALQRDQFGDRVALRSSKETKGPTTFDSEAEKPLVTQPQHFTTPAFRFGAHIASTLSNVNPKGYNVKPALPRRLVISAIWRPTSRSPNGNLALIEVIGGV